MLRTRAESTGASPSATRARRRRLQHVRVHHVDRIAGRIGRDLVENVGELNLEFLARHVAEVRRADDVVHVEQRVLGVAQRLLVVDVDRRHAGAAGPQRVDQRAALDQLRAAGVDQQRRGLHAPQVVRGDDAARRIDQAHVQGEHVAALEEGEPCSAPPDGPPPWPAPSIAAAPRPRRSCRRRGRSPRPRCRCGHSRKCRASCCAGSSRRRSASCRP